MRLRIPFVSVRRASRAGFAGGVLLAGSLAAYVLLRRFGWHPYHWAYRVNWWVGAVGFVLLLFGEHVKYHARQGRATRIADQRRQKGLCTACGYDLRGSSGACPECGMARG